MSKKASIILPTFNGFSRGYLGEAIQSVLLQTHGDIQLLIIDDGSKDGTAALCQQYLHDPRVRYIYQENQGLSAARNTGIKKAEGEYLLFLDDDDFYECCMVERMLETFTQHPDPKIGMVYCAYTFIDQDGSPFGRWYMPAEGDIYDRLFYDNYAGSPSGTLIHRTVINRVGFFNEKLKSCEDYDMWLRIAKHYHVYSIDEALLRYRIHGDNMSSNIYKIETYQKKVLDRALLDSPERISKDRNLYYHHIFNEYAAKYFEVGDYQNFRRCCRRSYCYKFLGIKWGLKYLISYFPKFTRTLFEMKRRIP